MHKERVGPYITAAQVLLDAVNEDKQECREYTQMFMYLIELAKKQPSIGRFFREMRHECQHMQITCGGSMSKEVYAEFDKEYKLWDTLLSKLESRKDQED